MDQQGGCKRERDAPALFLQYYLGLLQLRDPPVHAKELYPVVRLEHSQPTPDWLLSEEPSGRWDVVRRMGPTTDRMTRTISQSVTMRMEWSRLTTSDDTLYPVRGQTYTADAVGRQLHWTGV